MKGHKGGSGPGAEAVRCSAKNGAHQGIERLRHGMEICCVLFRDSM